MKKIAFVVLAAYFAVGLLLILLDRGDADSVRILVVEESRSQLIASATEEIAFVFGVDDPEAFVVDPGGIVAATLRDADAQLALAAVGIDALASERVHEDRTYRDFRYRFVVDGITPEGAEFVFRNAELCLSYASGTTGCYAVGDVDLVFGSPGEVRRLDFTRLSAVFGQRDGLEAVAGIVVGLAPLSADVILIGVELHCSGLAIALGDVETVAEIPVDGTEVPIVGTGTDGAVAIPGEVLLYLPIRHAERLRAVTRFMVVLVYTAGGETERLVIDDFAFRTAFADARAYGSPAHVYEHRR